MADGYRDTGEILREKTEEEANAAETTINDYTYIQAAPTTFNIRDYAYV